MKLAYFIPVHHKLYQFRWLFHAIYAPEDCFCIHVDRKASAEFNAGVAAMANAYPNVLLQRRRPVSWGGWSQVAVELEGIKLLLEADSEWKYLINLSGQDYPLRPIAAIKQSLRDAWPNNFIRAWSFETIARDEPNDPHLRQRLSVELFGRRISTALRFPLPRKFRYKGGQWHILTREFCEWLIRDPHARRIAGRMKWTHIPDETFFQAAIMDSPFRDQRASDHGRLIVWPGPKTLTMEDYELFDRDGLFFGRKFDEQVNREVLERRASSCGFPIPDDSSA